VGGRHVHFVPVKSPFPFSGPSLLAAKPPCQVRSCDLKLWVLPGPQWELEADEEAMGPRLKRLRAE